MIVDRSKLQLVILKSFYDCMDNEAAKVLFPKLIDLKIKGYQKEYPYGVLPFDTSDFIATHIILCSTENEEIIPIMGMKSITHDTCKKHRIPFPMYNIIDKSNLTRHKEAIDKMLNSFEAQGRSHDVAYNGSYTVAPFVREDRSFSKECFGIASLSLIKYYQEAQIDKVIAICSTKFKIDRYKKSIGWDYLKWNNEELPDFDCYSLFGEKFVIMDWKVQNAAKSKELEESFGHLWKNRIVIQKEHKDLDEAVA